MNQRVHSQVHPLVACRDDGEQDNDEVQSAEEFNEEDFEPIHYRFDASTRKCWVHLAAGYQVYATHFLKGADGFAEARWGDSTAYEYKLEVVNSRISPDGKSILPSQILVAAATKAAAAKAAKAAAKAAKAKGKEEEGKGEGKVEPVPQKRKLATKTKVVAANAEEGPLRKRPKRTMRTVTLPMRPRQPRATMRRRMPRRPSPTRLRKKAEEAEEKAEEKGQTAECCEDCKPEATKRKKGLSELKMLMLKRRNIRRSLIVKWRR